ncbi:MAG: ribulose-phosphate 3-epimerase [Clostridiales bacterium]|nr:ribulose-phosphate 3-epimerase [Clostridiales bacterium]
MKKVVDVSVSTDPIEDYQNIIEYAKQMQGVADFLHCDIMNENFVTKNNYDYNLVMNINRNSLIMLDVHLMVNEPTEEIEKYLEAGANILTVHYEAFENKEDLVNAISYIKENGALAGISLKPSTPFKEIRSFAFNSDVILVMGVEPGKSGQELLEETYQKVREIDEFRRANNLNFKLEFDGGVNPETAKKLVDSGVDILVSGSYVFTSKNKKEAVDKLKIQE